MTDHAFAHRGAQDAAGSGLGCEEDSCEGAFDALVTDGLGDLEGAEGGGVDGAGG